MAIRIRCVKEDTNMIAVADRPMALGRGPIGIRRKKKWRRKKMSEGTNVPSMLESVGDIGSGGVSLTEVDPPDSEIPEMLVKTAAGKEVSGASANASLPTPHVHSSPPRVDLPGDVEVSHIRRKESPVSVLEEAATSVNVKGQVDDVPVRLRTKSGEVTVGVAPEDIGFLGQQGEPTAEEPSEEEGAITVGGEKEVPKPPSLMRDELNAALEAGVELTPEEEEERDTAARQAALRKRRREAPPTAAPAAGLERRKPQRAGLKDSQRARYQLSEVAVGDAYTATVGSGRVDGKVVSVDADGSYMVELSNGTRISVGASAKKSESRGVLKAIEDMVAGKSVNEALKELLRD